MPGVVEQSTPVTIVGALLPKLAKCTSEITALCSATYSCLADRKCGRMAVIAITSIAMFRFARLVPINGKLLTGTIRTKREVGSRS